MFLRLCSRAPRTTSLSMSYRQAKFEYWAIRMLPQGHPLSCEQVC
jgi:hypothetical protein